VKIAGTKYRLGAEFNLRNVNEIGLSGAVDVRAFSHLVVGNDWTAAIQAAIVQADISGTNVDLGPGVLGISASSETPGPSGLAHGIKIFGAVEVFGRGRSTVLRRLGAANFHMVNIRSAGGAQLRNLRIDGQATALGVAAAATSALGSGVLIESTSGTETRDVLVERVWIDDVSGYGLGIEWGHHRGVTVRSVYVNGCGADGIDIKRFVLNSFQTYAIVLDDIRVTNFGRLATDAQQAGVDIRGYCTASNIHVVGTWGTYARSGIRLRGGLAGDGSLGAQRSSIVNYYVERTTGGEATTCGVEANADDTATSNGVVSGCTYGILHQQIGSASLMQNVTHTTVRAFSNTYGFITAEAAHSISFIGCVAKSNTDSGFYLQGDDALLIAPVCQGNTNYHVQIAASADKTKIVFPVYVDAAGIGPILNSGTLTLRLEGDGITIGSASFKIVQGGTTAFEVSTAAGDSNVSVARATGSALVTVGGSVTDADIALAPKGAGFHALNNTRTATTVGAAGAGDALPATPVGYWRVKIAGTVRKIPYYTD